MEYCRIESTGKWSGKGIDAASAESICNPFMQRMNNKLSLRSSSDTLECEHSRAVKNARGNHKLTDIREK